MDYSVTQFSFISFPAFDTLLNWVGHNVKTDFKIIMWDIMSWDFKENISSNKIFRNVMDNVESGSIILFHNNLKSYNNLKKSLELILEKLKEQEYQFSATW